jgi:hypothetical protein
MKTKKLRYKPDFEYSIIGISTSEDDYKISWLLNKNTDIQLSRSENLEIREDRKTEILRFSVFKGVDKASGIKHRLVSNKCSEGYLVEELKNIDLFLVVYCKDENKYASKIISELKKLQEINAVFNIDGSKLKSKEKLIF